MATETRTDIRDRITAQIIAQLETGVCPWNRPWNAEHAAGRITTPLRWNGEPYKGINVLTLWLTAEAKGYSAPLWLTFQQCKELGGCVKAGEKASPVVYCNKIVKEEEDKEFFLMKSYNVFNAEQTTGLPEKYYQMAARQIDPVQRIESAEAFIKNTGAIIHHGGNSAHYNKADDRVTLPPFEFFRDPETYYSVALHELCHWSGHSSRLNRELKGRRNQDSYAREEMCAEIGAAFCCAHLGLENEPRQDHAAYVGHYLEILKGDRTAIFQAAAAAQRAADYLQNLQPKVDDETPQM